MKEQYKSILLAVVSGIVACIVCVGVIFILPTNNTLKGNENKLPTEPEIIAGDTSCATSELYCPEGYSEFPGSPNQCIGPNNGKSQAECTGGNEVYYQGTGCYPIMSKPSRCTSCNAGAYLTGDGACHSCPEDMYCAGGTSQPTTYSCEHYDEVEHCPSTCHWYNNGCHAEKAAGYVNAHGISVAVGESKSIGATTSGEATYTLVDGADKITLSGDTVTGVAVGSATIRITSAANNTYTAASKNITVQVTSNSVDCYKLVANQCRPETVEGTTCDNASGYYATEQECNTHIVTCPAGEGYDPGSYRCMTCSAGYYSPENDGVCHQCGPNEFSSSGSASCTTITAPCCKNPYGNATELTTLAECQAAVSSGATVSPGRCSARAVASVTASYTGTVYLNASEYNYDNGVPDEAGQYGFKTVTYTAVDEHGHVIDSSRINWSTNVTGSVASVVSATVNSSSYVVTYKGRGCVRGTSEVSATATGINGISGSKTSPSMTIKVNEYTRWRQSNWNAENSNNWPLLADGVDHEQCNSVSDPYEENGVTKYRYRYNRCGCGGGTTTYSFCCVANDGSNYNWLTGQSSKTCPSGYTIDTTKTSATCLKTYACYKDSNNSVHWTSMPEASWVRVDKPESECKDQEACFENPAGTRLWGKFYDQIVNGYKLITTIKDPATCLYPTEEDACYVNNDDPTDYRWASTALDGYTKLEGVTDVEACQPELCYINKEKNEFEFGKFKNNDNYIPVYKTIEKDGAYVDVLISNIKECTTEVPVPPTALDVSKLVYVFMGILMACGIAFIYYSSVAKKQNQ